MVPVSVLNHVTVNPDGVLAINTIDSLVETEEVLGGVEQLHVVGRNCNINRKKSELKTVGNTSVSCDGEIAREAVACLGKLSWSLGPTFLAPSGVEVTRGVVGSGVLNRDGVGARARSRHRSSVGILNRGEGWHLVECLVHQLSLSCEGHKCQSCCSKKSKLFHVTNVLVLIIWFV